MANMPFLISLHSISSYCSLTPYPRQWSLFISCFLKLLQDKYSEYLEVGASREREHKVFVISHSI